MERERKMEREGQLGGSFANTSRAPCYPYVSTAPVPAHIPPPPFAPLYLHPWAAHLVVAPGDCRCTRRRPAGAAGPVQAYDSGTPSQNLEPEGCEISLAGDGKMDVTTRLGGAFALRRQGLWRTRRGLVGPGPISLTMGFRCGTRASGFPSLLLSWEAGERAGSGFCTGQRQRGREANGGGES